MAESRTVELRLVAGSLGEIQEFLGTGDGVPSGRVSVVDGLVLDDVRVVKSSGFEGTQFVLEAVTSVVTTVASGVLTTWLTERLKSRPKVTATVDGEEVRGSSGPPG
jgi:hypothetical protein